MARAGYDFERLWSAESRQSLMVEFDHAVIRAPDDEERRRVDTIENRLRQIRPPAPRYDGPDTPAEFRGRDQSRGGAGARAEQSERHLMKLRVLIEPVDGVNQPAGEQRDIEDVGAVALFIHRQEIEQQSRHAAFVERFGDNLVAWTKAARAASVREGYERGRAVRDAQDSPEPQRRNDHFAGFGPARIFPSLRAIRRRSKHRHHIHANRHIRIDRAQKPLVVMRLFSLVFRRLPGSDPGVTVDPIPLCTYPRPAAKQAAPFSGRVCPPCSASAMAIPKIPCIFPARAPKIPCSPAQGILPQDAQFQSLFIFPKEAE